MARRLKAMGNPKYSNGFELSIHDDMLSRPYSWKSPKRVFVNSMSDLFHENIPDSYIHSVFKVMHDNPQHIFQVLTKRSENLIRLNSELSWDSNIWMGVTVENKNVKHRINHLKKTSAEIKFLSIEPLLEPLGDLDLEGIDWVIVGGESGPRSRAMEEAWVTEIWEECQRMNIPFFFKQWGGKNKKKAGRIFMDKTWDEYPIKS
jgi:protein gp37